MTQLSGLNVEVIGEALGTTAAVARQAIYEARCSLRQMAEGREMSCERVMRAVSDGDRRILRGREVRAHLRHCSSCAAFKDAISTRRHDFAALSPLPAAASAGLLASLLGGGHGGSGAAGGALASGLGAGAGKTLATSAMLKSALAVVAVAAVGTGAADAGGLINLPLPGRVEDRPARPSAGSAASGSEQGERRRERREGPEPQRAGRNDAFQEREGERPCSRCRGWVTACAQPGTGQPPCPRPSPEFAAASRGPWPRNRSRPSTDREARSGAEPFSPQPRNERARESLAAESQLEPGDAGAVSQPAATSGAASRPLGGPALDRRSPLTPAARP
jgi:hypothetical protein